MTFAIGLNFLHLLTLSAAGCTLYYNQYRGVRSNGVILSTMIATSIEYCTNQCFSNLNCAAINRKTVGAGIQCDLIAYGPMAADISLDSTMTLHRLAKDNRDCRYSACSTAFPISLPISKGLGNGTIVVVEGKAKNQTAFEISFKRSNGARSLYFNARFPPSENSIFFTAQYSTGGWNTANDFYAGSNPIAQAGNFRIVMQTRVADMLTTITNSSDAPRVFTYPHKSGYNQADSKTLFIDFVQSLTKTGLAVRLVAVFNCRKQRRYSAMTLKNRGSRSSRGNSIKDESFGTESRPLVDKSSTPAAEKNGSNGAALYPPFYRNAGTSLPPYVREGDIDYPFEDITGAGDENKMRGNWSSKVDFILAALGFCVGLGNIWRFPYYCYINGGGAFLIPYLIMMLLAGMPIFFMELIIGQFSSLGCISVWKVVPLFKGIGIAMFLVSCVVSIYYNMVTAWSIFYLINALQPTVPWASCYNDWNTKNCSIWTRDTVVACQQRNGTVLTNGTCVSATATIDGLLSDRNYSSSQLAQSFAGGDRIMPSLEYFHNHVLKLSDGVEDVGTIHWHLALYLLAAWAIVFFCLFKGIKTSGKVVYITTVAPYVIMLVLLVRVLTLPGSFDGLLYYFTPRWDRMLDLKVWGDAAVQVFFSLSSCLGGFITLASYNRFHNDCFKDMWLVAIGDTLTSIFAGCVTFATIGFMTYELDINIADFDLKAGVDLTFVVYSEAIAKLPVAPLYAILFFVMLIMLTITTEFFIVETIVTAICDEFPERLRKNHRHVLTFVCLGFYVLGVPLCTQAGLYWFLLLDYYAATWSLVLIAFFEVMAIAWVYGVDNLLDNVKWMVRYYPKPYLFWKVLWKFFCPVMLMAILSFAWLEYRPVAYGIYEYPYWAHLVGWCISLLPIAAIPITAFIQFCLSNGTFLQRWRDLMSPEDDWGPALAIHRVEYYPLQIPEARRPLDPPAYMNGDLAGNGASPGARPSFIQSDMQSSVAEPTIPSFDRETAI
uniref:Transporter n=2 Tax=Plectus sambesii TaxID=2011161 RepID=A0A914W3A0_9BILA